MPRDQQIRGLDAAAKDSQKVTSEGETLQQPIAGVALRRARTHADERGSLCEIYDERWGFTAEPVPYVYLVSALPGQVRGWVVHLDQDDRLFFGSGTAKVVLYDAREDSDTFGNVNVFFLGAHDRALLRIPAGVFHAVKNVGVGELLFVNLPTRPYEHSDPDKFRLPLDSEVIPYRL